MVNVLIADNNINYVKNLMNYINEGNEKIRVTKIAEDGTETLKILNNDKNIDIALLDFDMPGYDANQICKKVINKEKYKQSIVLISGKTEEIQCELRNNEMIYGVIDKFISLEKICVKLNALVDDKEEKKNGDKIKKKIIKELTYLGYDISHKGTIYLVDSIVYAQGHQDKYFGNLKRDVYPAIAKKYNENLHNIKCYIARETTKMYVKCDYKKLQNYFCFAEDDRPNVRTVVNTVINKINC